MKNIPLKNDGDDLDANEWNPVPQELIKAVETSGQIINETDNFQVSKSISNYSAGGSYYIDAGSGNDYVLESVDTYEGITKYTDGMEVRFDATHSNTNSSTVNINSVGVLPITIDGSPLVQGDIVAGNFYKLRYVDSATQFYLIPEKTNTISSTAVLGFYMTSNVGAPTTTWDFTSGKCSDSIGSFPIINTATFSKNFALTWTPGAGNGGRATAATLIPSALYYSFALSKADGTFDIGYDNTPAGTNIRLQAALDGYIKSRRIGAFFTKITITDLRPMIQYGNNFIYTIHDADDPDFKVINVETGTTYTHTIGTAHGPVTTLIEYSARVFGLTSETYAINIFNPDQEEISPVVLANVPNVPSGIARATNIGAGHEVIDCGRTWINTDGISRLSFRVSSSHEFAEVGITSLGWYDDRNWSL
ncbi:hypothetical protein KAR91_14405 [Candidatus Pacearchaeota archaeon]|nr:hypothetical protein [Candidatus Pacearchaeota archaeon]